MSSCSRRRTDLQVFAVLALVAIFLLLQLSFRSWRLATLSFLTLPSALVGGVLAAFAAGGVITLGSLVGFLSVLGIAARNGIMMISHFQHLEQFEGETFGVSLVLRGARERLRPILMTTGATALAILPLVIYGNLPGHEIEYPMAVVILGGLVTSTLLNLFVLPALYLRFGGGSVQAETNFLPEPTAATADERIANDAAGCRDCGRVGRLPRSVAWGAEKFDNVAVYLEQTAEDEDSEVAFEAISATAGLAALKVVAPDESNRHRFQGRRFQAWDAASHPGIARTEERRQASGRLPGRRLQVHRDQRDRCHAAGRGEAKPQASCRHADPAPAS